MYVLCRQVLVNKGRKFESTMIVGVFWTSVVFGDKAAMVVVVVVVVQSERCMHGGLTSNAVAVDRNNHGIGVVRIGMSKGRWTVGSAIGNSRAI